MTRFGAVGAALLLLWGGTACDPPPLATEADAGAGDAGGTSPAPGGPEAARAEWIRAVQRSGGPPFAWTARGDRWVARSPELRAVVDGARLVVEPPEAPGWQLQLRTAALGRPGALTPLEDGERLVVGAAPLLTTRPGSARVYLRAGTTWAEEDTLTPSLPASEVYGFTVAVAESGTTALVGHQSDGAIHLFQRRGTMWAEDALLESSRFGTSSNFGVHFAFSGDGNRVLAGAPLYDPGGVVARGAASTFAVLDGLDDGDPCRTDQACESGFCVDGVCCDTACGDGALDDCQACAVEAGGAIDGVCGGLDAATAARVICRPSLGLCDLEEVCVALETECPFDALAPATAVCRAAVGDCDAPELCSGAEPGCPPDELRPAGAECRRPSCAAGRAVDGALCDGLAASCPAPVERTCAPYLCGALACRTRCDGDDGCVAGFRCDGGECVMRDENADAGLPDIGRPDAGRMVAADAGPATVGRDGGRPGAAPDPGGGGCSCRVAARRERGSSVWLAGLVILALLRRRRLPASMPWRRLFRWSTRRRAPVRLRSARSCPSKPR